MLNFLRKSTPSIVQAVQFIWIFEKRFGRNISIKIAETAIERGLVGVGIPED